MSRHIPEREYFGQGGQEPPLGPRPKIAREERDDLDPPLPAVGEVGEIGRTPIPVAESTRHPGEKFLPSVREHGGESLVEWGGLQLLPKVRARSLERLRVDMKGEDLSGHCPSPQIHTAHQRQRQGERGQPHETPKDRTEVLMSKSTLPLGNNCWKLTRDVKEG